jgi:hypothetical protein
MKRKIIRACLPATLGLFWFGAAEASDVVFTGSMTGTSTNVLAPSCAPLNFLSTLTGTGSSSLGSFSYTHHVCLSGPGPLQGVDFLLDFSGGDTLYGNLNGVATPSGIPLLNNISFTYSILGEPGSISTRAGHSSKATRSIKGSPASLG